MARGQGLQAPSQALSQAQAGVDAVDSHTASDKGIGPDCVGEHKSRSGRAAARMDGASCLADIAHDVDDTALATAAHALYTLVYHVNITEKLDLHAAGPGVGGKVGRGTLLAKKTSELPFGL